MATAEQVQPIIEAPEQQSALAVIERMTPEMIFAPGAVDPLIERIEQEVRAQVPDLTTEKGRSAIKSLAYKVARSKTFLDDAGKKLVEEQKRQIAQVDAERRRIRERLDSLKDEARKPLTEWEAAESERITKHQNAIAFIEQQAAAEAFDTSARIKNRIDAVNQIFEREWHEFLAQAAEVKDRVLLSLHASLEITKQREAEAAELAKLRQEKAEREERDRIEREAREAQERAEAAEKARKEREEQIAREAREKAEKEAQEREARLQREKEEAEARAKEADSRRQLGHRSQILYIRSLADNIERISASAIEQRMFQVRQDQRDWQEFAAEAATVKAQVITALEAALDAARERERIAQEQAAEAERARIAEQERQRLEDQRKAQEAAAKKREENKRHRAKVHREIAEAIRLADLQIDDDSARRIMEAIVEGSVPHVEVRY